MSLPSLLPDHELEELIESHQLRIEPYDCKSLNPTSIDLQLGSILVQYPPQTIKLGVAKPESQEIDIAATNYTLQPGEFILGTTKEKVTIPNGYCGFIETKGDIARAGIQVHNSDGHIEPGFSGHITLEITNMHREGVYIDLIPETHICMLFIVRLSSPCKLPYNGKYLNQVRPTTYLP